jgi:hypothetical protein
MMTAEAYLSRSRLFRRLKSGPHGQLLEFYAARLVRDGLGPQSVWQSLKLLGDLINWAANCDGKLTDLNEDMVERYLRHRSERQPIWPGERAALKRLLSVLREAGMIAPAMPPSLTPHEQIFEAFSDYLRKERGLAPRSIVEHGRFIRLFLHETCPAGASDLGRISQEDVIPTAQTTDLFTWAFRPSFLTISSYKTVIGRGRWYNYPRRAPEAHGNGSGSRPLATSGTPASGPPRPRGTGSTT